MRIGYRVAPVRSERGAMPRVCVDGRADTCDRARWGSADRTRRIAFAGSHSRSRTRAIGPSRNRLAEIGRRDRSRSTLDARNTLVRALASPALRLSRSRRRRRRFGRPTSRCRRPGEGPGQIRLKEKKMRCESQFYTWKNHPYASVARLSAPNVNPDPPRRRPPPPDRPQRGRTGAAAPGHPARPRRSRLSAALQGNASCN